MNHGGLDALRELLERWLKKSDYQDGVMLVLKVYIRSAHFVCVIVFVFILTQNSFLFVFLNVRWSSCCLD